MNHQILKQVIFDQRNTIQNEILTHRDYFFEEKADYVVVGIRRAGKSRLLFLKIQQLVGEGIDWNQIIYVNFEDERLAEFSMNDFNDIVETAAELTDKRAYFFLDEVQNIDGWERFARRMADAHEHIYITGSNARMLSKEMEGRLGGRFMSLEVMPYSFEEYLSARQIPHDENALYTTAGTGQIMAAAGEYMHDGGLPETLDFRDKHAYVENVYHKILLGDIASRYEIRNVRALRILMKKMAETVGREISFSRLHNAVCATGINISKDSVISYAGYAEDAYLIFETYNYISRFSEREGTPRFYFIDNGILNLFLINKDPILLENAVAVRLRRRMKKVFYFKSAKTGIDIDFYLPEQNEAIQVAYTLNDTDVDREVGSLVKLSHDRTMSVEQYSIITFEDKEQEIRTDGITIHVMPLYRFLMMDR